jgi:hypothetical protein
MNISWYVLVEKGKFIRHWWIKRERPYEALSEVRWLTGTCKIYRWNLQQVMIRCFLSDEGQIWNCKSLDGCIIFGIEAFERSIVLI